MWVYGLPLSRRPWGRPLAHSSLRLLPRREGVVKAATEEVLLDVVVRDKKGHEVKDLKPEDVQIFDNGEPKKIKSFRLIEGNEAVGSCGARKPLDPLHKIRLLTMIFQFRSAARRQAQSEAGSSDHGSTLTAPTSNRGNVVDGERRRRPATCP